MPIMSQIVPPGYHVHVPAEAEVISMGASSLPAAIRRVLFLPLDDRSLGQKRRKKRTVICVFPVNIVKTVQCKETRFLELQIPNSSPEESRNRSVPEVKATKKQQPQRMQKVCEGCGSLHSEPPLALQVSSSNFVFSEIKKALAHVTSIENTFRTMISLCGRSTSTKKMNPVKENILVIYKDIVYLTGTDFKDEMVTESQIAKSSNIMSQIETAEEVHDYSSAYERSGEVVDTVSSQMKASCHIVDMEKFTHPGICQLKERERIIRRKAVTPCINQESDSKVQDNTNRKCINSHVRKEHFNLATKSKSLPKKRKITTKTPLIKSGIPVFENKEAMPASSRRTSLRKILGHINESSKNTESVPTDVIKCCNRKRKKHLKSCTASGLKEGKAKFETKMCDVKDRTISVKPGILKKSTLLRNPRHALLNKSERNTQIDLKTLTAFPQGCKQIRKSQDILTNIKRRSGLPKLHKTRILSSNLVLKVPAHLKEGAPNQRKVQVRNEGGKSKKMEYMEQCSLGGNIENANTILPITDQAVRLHSNVRQRTAGNSKKRTSKLLDNMTNTKKRNKNIEYETLNTNIEPASNNLQNLENCLQSTTILKCLAADLKPKVPKKRRSRPSHNMVKHAYSPSTLKVKDWPDLVPRPGTWIETTQPFEKHVGSESNLPMPLTEVDEDTREQRIQRLKERFSEQKRALEAMKTNM